MPATSGVFEHAARRTDLGAESDPDSGPSSKQPLAGRSALALDRLDDDLLLDELADRLADRLAARLTAIVPERPEGLVDAHEVARMSGRSRAWVYDHAGELGAVPLGSGPRPRLGFSPARVAAHLDAGSQPGPALPLPIRAKPRRRRTEHSASVEALLNGRI
jgi:hypothetical protein